MQLVESWSEVEKNIRTLEAARTSRDKQLRNAYELLIKRGTCFIAYQNDAGIAFGPSKFLGYFDNKIYNHKADHWNRDGRETNKAIATILRCHPDVDPQADSMYMSFCRSLGFEPNKAGNFGVARKYWITADVSSIIEVAAEKAIKADPALTETEKEQLIKSRIGQGRFREDLICIWGKCCLTECNTKSLLRASHIKPWSRSDNQERLDKFNGLLLTPNADLLFDQGYITFSNEGELIISDFLPKEEAEVLLAGCKKRINLREPNKPYLAYHRENRFRSK